MDFPVTPEFVASANPRQLHDEAGGIPAFFVEIDGEWFYRVQEHGPPVDPTLVEFALDNHVPVSPPPPPTTQARTEVATARDNVGSATTVSSLKVEMQRLADVLDVVLDELARR